MASLEAQAQTRGRPAGQKAQLLQFSQLSQLTQLSDLALSLERATSAPGLSRSQQRPFSAAPALSRNQLADGLRAGDGLRADRTQRPATSTARRAIPLAKAAQPQQARGFEISSPARHPPPPASRDSSQTALLPRSTQRRSITASCYVDPGRSITVSRGSVASMHSDDHAAELRASVERLAFQLQRIEGVTSTMTPAHTLSLQQKLAASFGEISERVDELDVAFLTQNQKRRRDAANQLIKTCRGYLARKRYHRARGALLSWRSRELMQVQHVMVAWLRRREDLEARTHALLEYRAGAMLQRILGAWRAHAVAGLPARRALDGELRALRHWRLQLQARCFSGWHREAHAAQQAGITWVVRGGRRVAMRLSERGYLQAHLKAWWRVIHVAKEVERLCAQTRRALVLVVFGGLRQAVRRQAQLRLLAVTRWVEHAKVYQQLPFRAWYVYVVGQRISRRTHDALVRASRWRRGRAMLRAMVVAWRELARRGPRELRSREQLCEALQAQEGCTARLEENMLEYGRVLHEAEQALLREQRAAEQLQLEAAAQKQEMVELCFELHAAQQECLRLRAALRSFELRYPRAFVEPGEAAEGLPETPYTVSKEELNRLLRCRQLLSWAGATERYAPLPRHHGGTAADEELAHLLQLLHFVRHGELPHEAPDELRAAVAPYRAERAQRDYMAQAAVLTDDFETARPLRTKAALWPETPARPPASSGEAVADIFGNERSSSELLGDADARQPPISLATFGREADATLERPARGDGATRIATRVRERRDELESRERQRVNIYVRTDADEDVESSRDIRGR